MRTRNDVHYNPYVDPYNGHEYVDFGLTSGKKWAKCLLGMSGETDVENALYFQWGDTEGHVASDKSKVYNWANAPFNNGSSSYNSAYFSSVKDIVCPNGILSQEYDAAHVILGGKWRLPTIEELQELYDNTEHALYTVDGVKGIRFTSKSDISKSLFIPFIGWNSDDYYYDEGVRVRLWSSSLSVSYTSSAFGIDADNNGKHRFYDYSRCFGYGVLGVID